MAQNRKAAGPRDHALARATDVTEASSLRRSVLLGTVAAGMMLFGYGRSAQAGPDVCTSVAGVATCQGNQSGGISNFVDFAPTDATLNVNNLTQNIAPVAGTDGIAFNGAASLTVTINSDTGPFAIVTNGGGADGIFATAPDSVSITHTGDITSNGSRGIYARAITVATATTDITFTGTINAETDGIYALANQAASVTSTGDITSNTGVAIEANSQNADATVDSTGNIVGATGIYANAASGVATITSVGNVTTDGTGLSARGGTSATVGSIGNIITNDDFATGLFAVSAGDASVTSSGNITTFGEESYGIKAITTGTGNASVISSSNITTRGTYASGIESINTGTGNVSVISSGNIATFGDEAYGINASAPSGGDVSVMSSSTITTQGEQSHGIRAFSNNGAITVSHTGNITTSGVQAYGIQAYTKDGSATVNHTGDITTSGLQSYGIRAYGGAEASVTSSGNITTSGGSSHGIFALGYNSVSVHHTGDISIGGDQAYGIRAFSVDGPLSVTQIGDITTSGVNGHGIGVEAFGGPITVNHTGNITTFGDQAYGIKANGTDDVSVISLGNIATSGEFADAIDVISANGPINVQQTGNLTTQGRRAAGIFARINGTGNVSVMSSGNITTGGYESHGIYAVQGAGGVIAITQQGDITVTGDRADAIKVTNPDGAGSSLVTIKAGSTITGGTGSGDGIDISGGTVNRVKNYGTITTLGENAIRGGTGAEIVDNYGTVTGNIHLGDGANAFNNMSGGLFNSGATAFLGADNLFTNAGIFAPGGVGRVRTTALTGNIVQTSSGSLAVDVDLKAATTDRINVTGTAKLKGTVAVKPKNPAALTDEFVILSADGGVTNNGLTLGPVSPLLQAVLLYPNANDVVLGIDVDLTPDGLPLNRNQTNIAKNLGAVLDAGGGTMGPVFDGLFNLLTADGYRKALDQLSSEIYADTEIAAVQSSFDFSDSLLSCHVNGTSTADINREGQCLWIGAKGHHLDGDATDQYLGFDETNVQFAGGAQFALNSDWRLGVGLGYQSSSLSTDTNASSDGDQVQGGVALKYNPGALLLAGVFSGGRGWYDTMRPMDFGGFTETARSDHEIDVLQGRLHASYVLGTPGLYYKPMLDMAVTDVALDDVRETGAGGASLLVRGDNHTVFSVSPGVELGTEWWWANGTLVRPYARAGVTWYSEDDVTVRASFSGAPAGVSAFAVTAGTDEVQADVAAGIEMISDQDSALRIFYDGHFGDRIAVHAAGVKATVKF